MAKACVGVFQSKERSAVLNASHAIRVSFSTRISVVSRDLDLETIEPSNVLEHVSTKALQKTLDRTLSAQTPVSNPLPKSNFKSSISLLSCRAPRGRRSVAQRDQRGRLRRTRARVSFLGR